MHRKREVAKALHPAPDLSCSRRHFRGALSRTRAPEGRSAAHAVCRRHGACRNILTDEAFRPHFNVPGLALVFLSSTCPCEAQSGSTHPLRIDTRAGIVRPRRQKKQAPELTTTLHASHCAIPQPSDTTLTPASPPARWMQVHLRYCCNVPQKKKLGSTRRPRPIILSTWSIPAMRRTLSGASAALLQPKTWLPRVQTCNSFRKLHIKPAPSSSLQDEEQPVQSSSSLVGTDTPGKKPNKSPTPRHRAYRATEISVPSDDREKHLPDARFEVLGASDSILSVSLTASQNLFTRRGTLIGLSGRAENVYTIPHSRFLGGEGKGVEKYWVSTQC